MPDWTVNIPAVIVVLGLMILVHEWGHFVAAKAFGVRVEIFSIGFGPRLWGLKRGPTDYRVSALPLGGYVKMAGDNPTEDRAGAPDEFLSQARWQRAIIAMAGPAMNLLTAVVLTAVVFMVGMPQPVYFHQPAVVGGVLQDSPGARAGIRPGDRIVELNGSRNPNWEQVILQVLLSSGGADLRLVVERDGQRLPLAVALTKDRRPGDQFEFTGYPAEEVVIGQLTPAMPAERAGLESGDRVLALDGQPVRSPNQFAELIQQAGGRPMVLEVQRQGTKRLVQLAAIHVESSDPARPGRWQIGIGFHQEIVRRPQPVMEASRQAFWYNVRLTRQIVIIVGQLFQGKVSLKQLEGPVGIARHAGEAARRGILELVGLTAIISLNLGILNLLPIPILDGGHLLLLSVESLLRRDLSLSVKERFVQVGLVFLLVIFAIVMYNDVLKNLPSR